MGTTMRPLVVETGDRADINTQTLIFLESVDYEIEYFRRHNKPVVIADHGNDKKEEDIGR